MQGIMYRRVESHDVEAVAALAIRGMRAEQQPGVRISQEKVKNWIALFAAQHQHFNMVAFAGGLPVGAVAIYVYDMPFFERCEGVV